MNSQTYNEWLNETNNENKKNRDYVKYYYNKIFSICVKHNVNINNEKEFRKEIGLFIYNNSNKTTCRR